MKKTILALLFASGLMASGNGVYVGVDFGNAKSDITASIHDPNIETTETDSAGTQIVKVGYYFSSHHRLAGFFQNINVDDGSGSAAGIVYDYLIGDYALKPFVGVVTGFGEVKDDYFGIDMTGAFAGGELGLNYDFNGHISVEGGYRYLKTNMKDTVAVYVIDLGQIRDLDVSIDTIRNWFIGVNYKF